LSREVLAARIKDGRKDRMKDERINRPAPRKQGRGEKLDRWVSKKSPTCP
jgi:hypothetical protein